MTTLECCVKYDFVAPLNDKEHGKFKSEEFKAFEIVVKSFWQMLGSFTIWEHREKTSLRNFETGREIKY